MSMRRRASTGEAFSSASYEVDTTSGCGGWFRLSYTKTRTGEQVDYRITLTTTRAPWGAVRWWFVCPLVTNGRPCGRRAGKLYLPPGARYYGCRHCYRLTYTSCNESRKYDGLYRTLARDMGWDPADVKRVMKERYG